jgi:putative oxygen-independent coproporphyrinogen III oxidase
MMRVGVYVQIPFCQTKCTYCNFHTGVVSSARFAPYVDAVCREIREHRELLEAAGVDWPGRSGRPPRRTAPLQRRGETSNEDLVVDTVYIGGGTPSLLDPMHLESILDAIRSTLRLILEGESTRQEKDGPEPRHFKTPASEGGGYSLNSEGEGTNQEKSGVEPPHSKALGGCYSSEFVEVTLEADPETIEAEKAAAWVRAGINRVSFGVQSFADKELAAAGRMHRRADIYRAAPILREAGIGNIGFDLIAGLPHQTKESWQQSLDELAALGPEHVSVYLLEIDEGSRLGREVLQGGARYSAGALPSEDEMAEFYETAQEFLSRMGYRHYEISNWAKPGFESHHNLKYWRREPYLGFGAGAHSFSGMERWANAHDAAAYVSALQSGRLPVEQLEKVTVEQALEEELFLGLRQLEGIDVSRIERDYDVKLGARFERLASAGLVERDGDVVRLVPARLSISNEVFVELLR